MLQIVRCNARVTTVLFFFFLSQVVLLAQTANSDSLRYPDETHLRNIQQLTFGGDNAEAYWSYDGKKLVFQRTSLKDGVACDQIFVGTVPAKVGEPFTYKMVSTGKGRTTCAYFTYDNKHIIYASTHLADEACPPVPDRAKYGNKYTI